MSDIVEQLERNRVLENGYDVLGIEQERRLAKEEIERLRAAIFPLSFLENITKQEVDDRYEQGIKAGMHRAAEIVRGLKLSLDGRTERRAWNAALDDAARKIEADLE